MGPSLSFGQWNWCAGWFFSFCFEYTTEFSDSRSVKFILSCLWCTKDCWRHYIIGFYRWTTNWLGLFLWRSAAIAIDMGIQNLSYPRIGWSFTLEAFHSFHSSPSSRWGDQGEADHHQLGVWSFKAARGVHCGEGPPVSGCYGRCGVLWSAITRVIGFGKLGNSSI